MAFHVIFPNEILLIDFHLESYIDPEYKLNRTRKASGK